MSALKPTVAAENTTGARFRLASWHVWGAALLLGVGVGILVVLLQRHGSAGAKAAPPLHAAAVWPAGARPAPDFRLRDAGGTPFSLRGLRGRLLLVTFIDPVCRDLCPLEAQTLMTAVRGLPPAHRPRIVAVSVNPWADERSNFALDATHWHLGPEWRWGVGTKAQLARVWRDYDIGWQSSTKTIAGVTVHQVAHTEGSYLIDASGHERALFLAPYSATDVLATIRDLG
ncbi:MAG TPA: SCO family protein [Gaiellaceae bacterium]|jgi:cytochrome oxidase Cu insertion factor (SCO1/SenC/PrrC family)|nr:SCO family protein [Gaiellaceae bacterium]